jgi:serine protease inhibitor
MSIKFRKTFNSYHLRDLNLCIFDHFLANGIFYQESFSLTSDFTGKIQKMLQTSVANIKAENFSENPGLATRNINNWVSEKTMGKIPQLFDEALDSQERFKKHKFT